MAPDRITPSGNFGIGWGVVILAGISNEGGRSVDVVNQENQLQPGVEDQTTTVRLSSPARQRRRSIPALQVLSGEHMLEFVTIRPGASIVLGRDSTTDFLIPDKSVSRRHARVSHPISGRLLIEDLGSSNGTWINGYTILRSPLRPGDQLQVGNALLRFDLLSAEELSHLERVKQKLLSAGRDSLTGLRTRSWITDELSLLLAASEREEQPVAGLFVDLDKFKQANDRHGHRVGDVILRTVSRLLLLEVRDGDACVRYGGDELFVVLPGANEVRALEVAERVRAAVARFDWESVAPTLVVTVSIGVSERRPQEDWESWFSRTDRALYRAKERGRNGGVA